ncbi:hypothetical protein DITRI_Ditri16bG0122500 [Diplodiscus trichospermus]
MTLQRSSVSFRRQGSSGRIWNDRHIIDPKTGLPNAPAAAAMKSGHDKENLSGNGSREEFFSLPREEIHHPQPANFEAPSEPENNVPRNPKPEENDASAQKGHRCGISVLFGRCMGPTA